MQGRRADHQRRPRPARRRRGPAGGAGLRQGRRRGARRLRQGADHRSPAVRLPQRRRHAAPRRLDRGGAGPRGRADGRAGRARPHRRRRLDRGQHPRRQRGGHGGPRPVHPARAAARPHRRRRSPRTSSASRSSTWAGSPSATPACSPSPCSPASSPAARRRTSTSSTRRRWPRSAGSRSPSAARRVARDYADLVRVTVIGAGEPVRVVGTTIGQLHRPHLLEAWGQRFDLQIDDPHLTLFRYSDVPGMVGRVGSSFGEHGSTSPPPPSGASAGRHAERPRGDGGHDRRPRPGRGRRADRGLRRLRQRPLDQPSRRGTAGGEAAFGRALQVRLHPGSRASRSASRGEPAGSTRDAVQQLVPTGASEPAAQRRVCRERPSVRVQAGTSADDATAAAATSVRDASRRGCDSMRLVGGAKRVDPRAAGPSRSLRNARGARRCGRPHGSAAATRERAAGPRGGASVAVTRRSTRSDTRARAIPARRAPRSRPQRRAATSTHAGGERGRLAAATRPSRTGTAQHQQPERARAAAHAQQTSPLRGRDGGDLMAPRRPQSAALCDDQAARAAARRGGGRGDVGDRGR